MVSSGPPPNLGFCEPGRAVAGIYSAEGVTQQGTEHLSFYKEEAQQGSSALGTGKPALLFSLSLSLTFPPAQSSPTDPHTALVSDIQRTQ